jgi:hypothetical protein
MSVDGVPIWAILLGTIGLVLLALEIGVRVGIRRKGSGKVEVSGAMVGATMGLLAFMLAFTFNGAAGRHSARKALVIQEANAIRTTWLRAGFLAEPISADIRGLLRDYVDLRVKAAAGQVELAEALRRSEALQDKMWILTLEAGRKDAGSIPAGLFTRSLNDVIDLHLERVTVGIRNRVPPTIWAALYLLLAVSMLMMGIQVGLSATRNRSIELALAVAFSAVLFLIIDLDRPQEGLVNVSQQAMVELQTKLHGR